jgi:hypothetical protein
VVERDPTLSWPCEQFKLPQRRRRNHRLVILNFGKQILVSPLLYLPLCLLVLLCFHSISCDVPYFLSIYCVYLSLCLSRSTSHIFCELDYLSCYNSLSLYQLVRPVWYTCRTGLNRLIAFKGCKFHVLPIHPPSSQLSVFLFL